MKFWQEVYFDKTKWSKTTILQKYEIFRFFPISPIFQKIPIFWPTLRPISQLGYAISVSNMIYIDSIALNLLSKTKMKALSYLFLEI